MLECCRFISNQFTLAYLYLHSSHSWPNDGNILVMILLEYIRDLHLPSQEAQSHQVASEATAEVYPTLLPPACLVFLPVYILRAGFVNPLFCHYENITKL